jgi:hypothetical protein
MKRLSMIVTIALTLTPLMNVSSQTPNANSRTPQSRGQAKRPKGRVLVNKLPAGAQGVTVRNGAVRLKPGHKFVEQGDGTIAVARIGGGGLGVGGTWKCTCKRIAGQAQGTCDATIVSDLLVCNKNTCNGNCELTVTVTGLTKGVIRF